MTIAHDTQVARHVPDDAPIRDFLARRPRWHVHVIPTGASWINPVERFFAVLADTRIRRGIHGSTQPLEREIRAFGDAHNAEPETLPPDQDG